MSNSTEKIMWLLKKEERALFMKHYVEQRSVDELADEMGVRKSVIYNRLSRGRKKLQTLFQGNSANEK